MARKFSAFISYRHHHSRDFAENLELAIKAYAKPLWQKPLAIFRDEKYLVPGKPLDELIRAALANSSCLIYLASPNAADSVWVADELRLWCREYERQANLIIVLTEGRIAFDPVTKALDWENTDCLPSVLRGVFDKVPFFIDATQFDTPGKQSLDNAEFRRAVNQIVAKLRGIDPIEMSGREMQQHRRNMALRNALFATVAVSAIGFAISTYFAEMNRREAESQTRQVQQREAALLASASRNSGRAGRHGQALKQALEGLPKDLTHPERPLAPELVGALIEAVSANRLAHTVADETRWVRAAALSDDGSLLGYGTDDGDVVLWRQKPAPGELAREHLRGWVLAVAFQPNGERLLGASHEGEAVVLDRDGNASRFWHDIEINSAAISADGLHYALGGRDGAVQVRNVSDGTLLSEMAGHCDTVSALRFTQDGRWLISTGHDNRGRLWRIEDGAELRQPLEHDDWIVAIDLDPAGEIVATASLDGEAKLWTLADGKLLAVLQHNGPVNDVRFNGDGSLVVTASRDGSARVWRVSDGQLLASLPHGRNVTSAAFIAGAKRVVTGGWDGAVRMWRIEDGEELAVLGRHEERTVVSQIATGPRGNVVLSASSDGQVRLWNVESEGRVWQIAGSVGDGLIAFGSDGATLLTSADGTCTIRDLTDDEPRVTIGPGETVQAWCEWLPQGNDVLFYPFDEGTLEIRNVGDGELTNRFNGHSAPVVDAALDPASGTWVTADLNNKVLLWPRGPEGESLLLGTLSEWPVKIVFDLTHRRVIAATQNGEIVTWSMDPPYGRYDLDWPRATLGSIAISADGHRLAIVTESGSVHLIDLNAMQRIEGFDAGDAVLKLVSFSPDSRTLAIAGAEGALYLWQPPDEPVLLRGHSDWISDLVFSPSGGRVGTASSDGTLRLWRVADGMPLAVLHGHEGKVSSLDFSPDGRWLASLAEDGKARLWRIERNLAELRDYARSQTRR